MFTRLIPSPFLLPDKMPLSILYEGLNNFLQCCFQAAQLRCQAQIMPKLPALRIDNDFVFILISFNLSEYDLR